MKIDKATRKQMDDAADALRTAKDAVTSAAEEYNAKRETLREVLQTTLDANRNEFDGKSARWQESDKGEEASAWLDDIEAKIGEIDTDLDLGLPDIDDVMGFPDQPE